MNNPDPSGPDRPGPDPLAAALAQALEGDRARVLTPPLETVLSRSRRRRTRRVIVTAAAAATALAVPVGMATVGPGGRNDQVRVAQPQAGATPVSPLLDSGSDASGAWQITVRQEDGTCLVYEDTYTESGACQLGDPPRLEETQQFPVVDAGRRQIVLAGAVPDAATQVEVTSGAGVDRQATLRRVGSITYFTTRIDAGSRVRLIVARDAGGDVVASVRDLPPLPDGPAGPGASAPPPPSPSLVPEMTLEQDEQLASQLRALARAPSAASVAALPFADRVGLGLGPDLLKTVPSSLLSRPATWSLPVELYNGGSGPFSALERLRDDRPYDVSVGPHSHCASPPRPAPQGLDGARRVSVQPSKVGPCLQWYTVDMFLRDGRIVAVTMDFWEP